MRILRIDGRPNEGAQSLSSDHGHFCYWKSVVIAVFNGGLLESIARENRYLSDACEPAEGGVPTVTMPMALES